MSEPTSIKPPTTDKSEIEDTRERLKQDAPLTDDALIQEHEDGAGKREREPMISPTPPVHTD